MEIRFDRSDVLALLALFISFITMGISIYETRILKSEQEIMRSQQKASVWPYIEKDINIEYTNLGTHLQYVIKNKGVGPALIKRIKLQHADSIISNDYQNASAFFSTFFQDASLRNLTIALQEKQVLSPEEEVILIDIYADRYPNDIIQVSKLFELELSICFASIYEDKWLLKNDKIGPEYVEYCPD